MLPLPDDDSIPELTGPRVVELVAAERAGQIGVENLGVVDGLGIAFLQVSALMMM